jgi:hypothetical protein
VIMALILLVTTQSLAKPTCDEVLASCGAALNAQIHENQLQKQIIQDQDKQHSLDTSHIQDLEARDSVWYRQPWVLILAGALAGGYVVAQIRK